MKNIMLFLFIMAIAAIKTYSQNENDLKQISKESNIQKTANSKDILTTLFRTGIDNLLGNKHSFNFSSSFYGIDSILRKKGTEISYQKERKLRQTTFNLVVAGDTANNITRISGGLTFTLLNNKDILLKKMDATDFNQLKAMSLFISILKRQVLEYISTTHKQEFVNDSINKSIISSWTSADKKNDFSNLHPLILEALNDSSLVPKLQGTSEIRGSFTDQEISNIIIALINGEDRFHILYKKIGEKYSRKPLWTLSPALTYDRVNRQAEYIFASDFTVGIGNGFSTKPLELEAKSSFKILNDTIIDKIGYSNKPFSISLGLNKVLIQNGEKESKMEFKLFTQYDYQFGKILPGTDAGIFSLNSTFRVNVFKSLWVPVTIKYDPKNGNFFGFLSITANLGN